MTSAVSKGNAPTPPTKPTAFKAATVKSSERMKPTTPIIGANRGQGANFATINKDRMNNTIKKLGM